MVRLPSLLITDSDFNPYPPLKPSERRQFSNNHQARSPKARERGEAIDEYELRHRRRFITFEEIMSVVKELGYHK